LSLFEAQLDQLARHTAAQVHRVEWRDAAECLVEHLELALLHLGDAHGNRPAERAEARTPARALRRFLVGSRPQPPEQRCDGNDDEDQERPAEAGARGSGMRLGHERSSLEKEREP